MKFKIWLESQKTRDYIDRNPLAAKVSRWLLHQPQIRKFLAAVDESSIIKSLKHGKTGHLVLPKSQQYEPMFGIQRYDDSTGNDYQHRIPVKVLGMEGNFITLERTDGKDFSEIGYKFPIFPNPKDKRTVELPAAKIVLVDQEKYQTYLRWITYAVTKGANGKIPAYFRRFWTVSEEGLYKSINNPPQALKTTDLSPEYFGVKESKPVPKEYRGGTGGVGNEIITFPDGFRWLRLDRRECRQEGDAGGHCGNTVNPKPGDNILSLRDKDNRVYLTFVINNGFLIEMKANGNKKPAPELHPYIIRLLEEPFVKGLGKGRYLPEGDFAVSDLDYENLVKLAEKRPDIAKASRFDITIIKNRNNIPRFLSRLQEKYKLPRMFDYDFNKKAFLVSGSEQLPAYGGGWQGDVSEAVYRGKVNVGHILSILQNNFDDVPKDVVKELCQYYRINIDEEEFIRATESFIKKDKDVKNVFAKSYREARMQNTIDEVNHMLRVKENRHGVFYQVEKDRFDRLIAKKYIGSNDVKRLMKQPEDVSLDVKIDRLGYVDGNDVRIDIFMESLKKNIRYLYYKGE